MASTTSWPRWARPGIQNHAGRWFHRDEQLQRNDLPNNNRINAGSHDNAGNQTSANGDTLAYDVESHVSNVTDGGGTESMLYDGFGNRVSKVVNGTLSTVYVYGAFG